jgi:hypothetical protein
MREYHKNNNFYIAFEYFKHKLIQPVPAEILYSTAVPTSQPTVTSYFHQICNFMPVST